MDLDAYANRLRINGQTTRDRDKTNAISAFQKMAVNNVNYKPFTFNDTTIHLLLKSTSNDQKKKFYTQDSFELGALIYDENTSPWLVVSKDYIDTDVTFQGVIQQCNHLFKFQNFNSTIIERYGIIESEHAERLNDGSIISISNSEVKIKLPYDDDTKKLFKDKRFLIEKTYNSKGNEIGVVYKITGFDSETNNFNGNKLLVLNVKADAFDENKDSLEHMICNYITPNSVPEPSNEDDEPELVSPTLLPYLISGSTTLKVLGSSRTYTFIKNEGQENDIALNYTVTSQKDIVNSYIITELSDYSIKITANQSNQIGDVLTIILSDTEDEYESIQFEIKVVSSF